MCGIVGVVSAAPVNQLIYDALLLLQHRGQDAAGRRRHRGQRHARDPGLLDRAQGQAGAHLRHAVLRRLGPHGRRAAGARAAARPAAGDAGGPGRDPVCKRFPAKEPDRPQHSWLAQPVGVNVQVWHRT